MQTAIVIGVGPQEGLGARLCERFASLGLHVFVAGRTQANLDSVVETIDTNGGEATAVVTDATDEAQVAALFERVKAWCNDSDVRYLRVVADPNAAGFYEAVGGRLDGEVASVPAPRKLPVYKFYL